MSEKLPFGSTALKPEIVNLLKEDGFLTMSDIQAKTIPQLLRGKNVLALSETGTGKTLAFALPILSTLEENDSVEAIILSPTVALLDQIKSVFESFTRRLGLKEDAVKTIYSKNDYNRSKPKIVLTTPTMFLSLSSHYVLANVKHIIIDEGDMILFDGFDDSLKNMAKFIDKKLVSFFSASLKEQQIKGVKSKLKIETVIDVRKKITNDTVSHHLVDYRTLSKAEALYHFMEQKKPYKTIAFVSSKEELYEVFESLKALSLKPLIVHGGLEKREIKNALNRFKNENEHLLLATDFVSRGIDIPEVDTILSLSLSKDTDYYFHRAGRCGRFSQKGDSYVFFTYEEEESVKRVKDLVRRGVNFDAYTLTEGNLRHQKGSYQFRNMGKKDRANQQELQKKIRHAVNQNKSKKVKPGYKKKVAKAVELVKFKHRRKVVLTNIAKSGGNVKDFHMEKERH